MPPITFDKLKLLVVEKDKAREDDAELQFSGGRISIFGPDKKLIGSVPYATIRAVSSSRSKQPRWRDPNGTVTEAKLSTGAFGFIKSERNWVGLVTPKATYVFRVDDDRLQKLNQTAVQRTGAALVRLANK